MSALVKKILSFSLTLIFILNFQIISFAKEIKSTDAEYYEYFKAVIEMVKDKYSGELDESTLVQESLKGIFNSMDDYTTFYSNDEAQQFFNQMDNQFEGIGVRLENKDGLLYIVEVFKNSPALRAGIKAGDIIIKVDNKEIFGMKTEEILPLIRGKAGTTVNLTVKRGTSEESIRVERGIIQLKPGKYKIFNNVGYIKLDSFSSDSSSFIDEALAYMDENKIGKIIFDLRGNPGGEVSQAIRIASRFVPRGVIAKLDYKEAEAEDTIYSSDLEKSKYKLVLLVDGGSASASEIVAGAVQDTKAGVLVGTKTFGKAKVQSIIPIITPEAYSKYSKLYGMRTVDAYDIFQKYKLELTEDEIVGWTKMTIGRYYTPNGRMIDLEGLNPDYLVSDNELDKGIVFVDLNPLPLENWDTHYETLEEILTTKAVLIAAGYYNGEFNGEVNQSYLDSLEKLQKDYYLAPSRKLDKNTRQIVNRMFDFATRITDRQLSKALELLSK